MEGRNANVRVEAAISPGLQPVLVDGIQIQQVVLNLTRNAIEAIEEARIANGVIKIAVEGTSQDEIVVSVTDSGACASSFFLVAAALTRAVVKDGLLRREDLPDHHKRYVSELFLAVERGSPSMVSTGSLPETRTPW